MALLDTVDHDRDDEESTYTPSAMFRTICALAGRVRILFLDQLVVGLLAFNAFQLLGKNRHAEIAGLHPLDHA
jgi:hypothetical protein